jgi:hypothetical protein
MNKIYLLAIFSSFVITAAAQPAFPQSWVGNWKGELLWYKGNAAVPQKIKMELDIQTADSSNRWTWRLAYGSPSLDSRPYTLVPKDTATGHWVIDEHNGILLDQYWIAGKLCGSFTVQNNTITNSYYMDGDKLVVEFYSMSAKPVAVSGQATETSPAVDSYKMNSYQKAVLYRTQ